MSQKWETQRGSSRVRVDRKVEWPGLGAHWGGVWTLGESDVPLPRENLLFGF